MKKVTIPVQSLYPVLRAGGNFRLNEKFWLSPIDYERLCQSLDLDASTNSLVFEGATLTAYQVLVPKEGITVQNPVTASEVKFKAHDSEQPLERYIGWQVNRIAPETKAIILTNSIVTNSRRSTVTAKPVAPETASEEVVLEEQLATSAAKPAVANATDEQPVSAEGEELPL